MKTFLIISLISLLGFLLNPVKERPKTVEESRNIYEAKNLQQAQKLVERGVWWLTQPGSVAENEDGSRVCLNFNISPSSLDDFYLRGMFAGLGSLFPAGPYSELNLAERSRLEWKGHRLQAKFEWAMGPHTNKK